MSTPVAILFARRDSIYKTLPDCDVWDEDRDARNWPGGCPVVAHPPCRAWGRLRHMAKPAPDEKDLAPFAVEQVRRFGGILEHPWASQLWPACGLPAPGKTDQFGGRCVGVTQLWFGHRAEKKTLLYVVGADDVPAMPLSLGYPTKLVGGGGAKTVEDAKRRHQGHPSRRLPSMTASEREHTPIEFAKWLVEVARRCKR